MLRTLSVIVTLATVSAPVAMAQGSGCEDAAVRVGANPLPRVGSPGWNDWVTLTGCGSRGAAVIGAALRSDGIRGETELSRLDQMAGMLDGWFQPSLVAAYEWLLRAPDASNAVRLRAMWLLAGLYVPDVEVAGPLQGYMAARCETYERTTTLREAPNTLPAAAYDQAVDAVAFAAADRSAPEYLRTTAQCWEGVIRDGLATGTRQVSGAAQEPAPLPPDDRTVVVNEPATVVVERPVRVVYDCGTRFVFYNDAMDDLAVRYDGYGGGVLRVRHGGPFVWVAARFGPVRFWLGDQELVYTSAVYRPCGGRVVYAPAIYPWYGWHVGLGVFVSTRVVAPRVYVGPRVIVARPAHPVVVVNRGHDNGRRDDGWHDPRGGRDDRPHDGGRVAVPRDGNGGGAHDRDSRGYGYRAEPGRPGSTVSGNGGPSRVSGNGGPSRVSGNGGPSRVSGGERVAVPKGGGVSRGGGYQPHPDRPGGGSKPSRGGRNP